MAKGKHAASSTASRLRAAEQHIELLSDRLLVAREWKAEADRVPVLLARIGELDRQLSAGATDREVAMRDDLSRQVGDLHDQLQVLAVAYMEKLGPIPMPSRATARRSERRMEKSNYVTYIGNPLMDPVTIALRHVGSEWFAQQRRDHPTTVENWDEHMRLDNACRQQAGEPWPDLATGPTSADGER